MRFVSFKADDRIRPGFIQDDRIRLISTPTLLDYIALPPGKRSAYHSDETVRLTDAILAAPLAPGSIYCVGRNYAEHAKEGATLFGTAADPEAPTFFSKAGGCIAAPMHLELEERLSSEYDFEAELAVVIGTRCKNVAADDAFDVIFGYSCFNDVTARDLQRVHHQWFRGKSLDGTGPFGPVIVSRDEIEDPHRLSIRFRLNDVEMQNSNTDKMIFRITYLVSSLSQGMTLEAGDIIATDTPEGVGFARTPPIFLNDGDRMEVDIEGIGSLRNNLRIR